IKIDWNGLPVSEVYPQQIMDLFRAKPVIVTGRYTKGAQGTIKLHGMRAGQPFTREIKVDLPTNEKAHDSLASLWARTKIEHLMSQDWAGMQNGTPTGDLKQQITDLGLQYRLMTQFTSFVAVEEKTITEGGQAKTVQVPVELPDGVSREGVFGRADKDERAQMQYAPSSTANIVGGGFGGVGILSRKMATEAAKQAPYGAAPPPSEPTMTDGSRTKTGGRDTETVQKEFKLESRLAPSLLQVVNCIKVLAVA